MMDELGIYFDITESVRKQADDGGLDCLDCAYIARPLLTMDTYENKTRGQRFPGLNF
ncbi:hypothetical protein RvY_10769 [Ramazzottius varieornatus]|uniref:Uncharacterized protein n=1 Tax=Ramazzottius varieornatus TaxID=947166 RepID=A0A1D1VJ95_RAMVA|nr:hypothetical protein RvY_10769 [Ramazzottius varieornatus]